MAAQSKLVSFLQFLLLTAINTFTRRRVGQMSIIVALLYIAYKIAPHLYRRYYDKVQYTRNISSIVNKQYDFIIVGAGTSGSCVAGIIARGRGGGGNLSEKSNGSRMVKPRVLLLEAGDADTYHPLSAQVIPAFTAQGQCTDIDWQYLSVPHSNCLTGLLNNQSKWPRGKVCGGSSVLNYMMYVRGHPDDYNQWSDEYGCGEHWSYPALLPYFKEYERCLFQCDSDYRGTHGLQAIRKKAKHNQTAELFVEAATNCGYEYRDDHNAGFTNSGVGFVQFTVDENGRRMTSFRAFVASLFGGKTKYNIDIVPNAHVSKILCESINAAQNKAIGVEINGKHRVFINDSGEVIVSGGAINSPQLLMLSGIGDKQHLREHNIPCVADIPGVGQNLRDHFMQRVHVTYDMAKMKEMYPHYSNHPSFWKNMYEYLVHGRGDFSTPGAADAQIFTQSIIAKKHNWPYNDLQLVPSPRGIHYPAIEDDSKAQWAYKHFMNFDCDRFTVRDYGAFKDRGTANAIDLDASLNAYIFAVRPQSVGEMRLRSNDYKAKPLLNPNYLSHEEDRMAYLDGCQKMKEIYEAEPFKSLGFKVMEFTDLGDGTFADAMRIVLDMQLMTIYHPVGTCKMGDISEDRFAVCDDRLKVRTFSNLRVCDASVMPDLTGGNTQAPCYVIGVKGAHMILQDWMQRCHS